jgi:exosortase D (VPLPA-CTERM-specific)
MTDSLSIKNRTLLGAVAVLSTLAVLYAGVIGKLVQDWWSDENYSHGLLIPIVIAFILWQERESLDTSVRQGSLPLGLGIVSAALLLLFVGSLGAELFTQRISIIVMAAGIVIYAAGTGMLKKMYVVFLLFLLAVPVPQIIFNKIAMPLQTYASQLAVWGIRLFEVPTVRMGNVIDILPRGSTQTISLEVVEACSGIRSLMTLVTLALVLVFFTRSNSSGKGIFSATDRLRAGLLMLAAVPIAVITNAARVTATGVLTYRYGIGATESTFHDISGWIVYVAALVLLLAANFLLKIGLPKSAEITSKISSIQDQPIRVPRLMPLISTLLLGAAMLTALSLRPEAQLQRSQLAGFPSRIGDWSQKGSEFPFDDSVKAVLRASDQTMREYTLPDGRIANIYVGYYASQKTGSTYHSPQNCLPGAGWVMKDPQVVQVSTPDGVSFAANRYIVENGIYRQVMIYWYQGRGRVEQSEYRDKLNTIVDSVIKGRTDGAMVRVMTDVGNDEAAALTAAKDLSSRVAAELPRYVPN